MKLHLMSAHRKKHTRQQHNSKNAPVPATQRTSGHLLWALLVAVFGLMIGYFAGNGSTIGLVIGAAAGAVLGWVLGRKMERDVAGK